VPEIRVLTEMDAEEFWAVRLRALREDAYAFGSAYEESTDTPIEDVEKRLRVSNDHFVLGAFSPNLVGTIGFYRRQGIKIRHKGTIWGVYVAPEARGQRLGEALMQAAIARAREIEGLEYLLLQVGVENKAAVALYSSAGFIVYGFERSGLKVDGRYLDEHLMTLKL